MVPAVFFVLPLWLTTLERVDRASTQAVAVTDTAALFPKAADVWHLVGQEPVLPVSLVATRYALVEQSLTLDPMVDFAKKHRKPSLHYVGNDAEVSISLSPGSPCIGACLTLEGFF